MKAGDRPENAPPKRREPPDKVPKSQAAPAPPIRRALGTIENVMQAQQRRRSTEHPAPGKGWDKSIRAAPLRGGHQTVHVTATATTHPNTGVIPMYNPADVRQAEGLWIVPLAAARRQSSHPASSASPPTLTEPDVPSSTPPTAASPPEIEVPLPSSSGASSSLMAGGPVELATLFELGPGWRRSASGGMGRVLVAGRSSSVKGGGSASRTPWRAESAVRWVLSSSPY